MLHSRLLQVHVGPWGEGPVIREEGEWFIPQLPGLVPGTILAGGVLGSHREALFQHICKALDTLVLSKLVEILWGAQEKPSFPRGFYHRVKSCINIFPGPNYSWTLCVEALPCTMLSSEKIFRNKMYNISGVSLVDWSCMPPCLSWQSFHPIWKIPFLNI